MRITIALLTMALAASPVLARRDLAVPPDKGWQHAATGVILTEKLAGLPRTTLSDNGEDERDVVAEFASADRATVVTIYIFHPGLMSVPMWFDRAQTALELKDVYGGVKPASADPAAFAPPGGVTASGLRQTYTPRRGAYRSTALAVAPVGDWLVAVRVSSKTLDPVTIDPDLTNILTAIRWPKASAQAPVAVPVAPCATTLVFTKAKPLKTTMEQNILGSVLMSAASKAKPDPAAPIQRWCREAMKPAVTYGIYRSGSADGYTLAIADSGRAVSVYKAFALPGSPDAGYSVTRADLDGATVSFPAFASLPQPDQVMTEVMRGNALSRTATGVGGKTDVTIHVPGN